MFMSGQISKNSTNVHKIEAFSKSCSLIFKQENPECIPSAITIIQDLVKHPIRCRKSCQYIILNKKKLTKRMQNYQETSFLIKTMDSRAQYKVYDKDDNNFFNVLHISLEGQTKKLTAVVFFFQNFQFTIV